MTDQEAKSLIRELRMGNHLLHEPAGCMVEFSHAGFNRRDGWIFVLDSFTQIPAKLGYVKPAPITSEILEHFGFEHDGVTWSNGPVMLAFSKEGSTWFPCGLSGSDRAKVLYVHHLQNIYFALTGKELEVQP